MPGSLFVKYLHPTETQKPIPIANIPIPSSIDQVQGLLRGMPRGAKGFAIVDQAGNGKEFHFLKRQNGEDRTELDNSQGKIRFHRIGSDFR